MFKIDDDNLYKSFNFFNRMNDKGKFRNDLSLEGKIMVTASLVIGMMLSGGIGKMVREGNYQNIFNIKVEKPLKPQETSSKDYEFHPRGAIPIGSYQI